MLHTTDINTPLFSFKMANIVIQTKQFLITVLGYIIFSFFFGIMCFLSLLIH